MPPLTRIASLFSCGLVLLTISACLTASRPDRGYSFQRGRTSGYSSSGSVGPSSAVPSVSSAVDLGPGAAIPADYWEDGAQGTALTSYLDKNRLPMVGAQVFTNSSGNRQVVLHGFVATEFGKQDAAAKARRYLGDPALPVVNRIVVRPELLASGGRVASSSPSPSTPSSSGSYSNDDVQSYLSQAQSQQNQSAFMPLFLLLRLMILFF